MLSSFLCRPTSHKDIFYIRGLPIARSFYCPNPNPRRENNPLHAPFYRHLARYKINHRRP